MRTIREAVLGMRRAPALTILSVMAIGLSVFSIGLFACDPWSQSAQHLQVAAAPGRVRDDG